jgi:hypothetical protein
MIDRVGAILTSVGVARQIDRGVFLNERIGAGDITEKEVRTLVAGDLGGIVIPREKLTEKQCELIDRLNLHWNGVRLEHIRRCALEASDTRPGVILFARGAHRLEVVLQCIRLNLVNHLIVDQEFFDSALAKQL